MKDICRQGIDYHISETELNNHNSIEVVIKELRREWYHTMVNKRVTKYLWEYGISWVSEVTLLDVFQPKTCCSL